MRVCSTPGCPNLYPKAEGRHCRTHRTQAIRARGTASQRGYGNEHQQLRRKWAPIVARGHTPCAKCKQLIAAGTAWDLGHNNERDAYTGPEHATCNRSAGGTKAHS